MRAFINWLNAIAVTMGGPGLFAVAFLDSSFVSLPQINDVLVVLGPFNEHIMAEENRAVFQRIRDGIKDWLTKNQVQHIVPPTMPSPLYSYTGQRRHVEATGATLRDLLADLERQFPGIRFRMIDEQEQIREHIRIFINRQLCTDLSTPLQADDVVQIITSISGGLV